MKAWKSNLAPMGYTRSDPTGNQLGIKKSYQLLSCQNAVIMSFLWTFNAQRTQKQWYCKWDTTKERQNTKFPKFRMGEFRGGGLFCKCIYHIPPSSADQIYKSWMDHTGINQLIVYLCSIALAGLIGCDWNCVLHSDAVHLLPYRTSVWKQAQIYASHLLHWHVHDF